MTAYFARISNTVFKRVAYQLGIISNQEEAIRILSVPAYPENTL